MSSMYFTPMPFLSTPSARRATAKFNEQNGDFEISIHALCEEGDMSINLLHHLAQSFLSTPSARRATNARNVNTDGTLFLSTPSARRATSSTRPT